MNYEKAIHLLTFSSFEEAGKAVGLTRARVQQIVMGAVRAHCPDMLPAPHYTHEDERAVWRAHVMTRLRQPRRELPAKQRARKEDPNATAADVEPLLSDYIDRAQLAKELHVTTRTLDKWAWLRKGPRKIKIGGRCYYHRQDVRDWLESVRQTDTGGTP